MFILRLQLTALSRKDEVSGIRTSNLVSVEASNNVVFVLNEPLSLNPVRGLAVSRDTSVELEGVSYANRPEVATSVTGASKLGVRQEVENSMQRLGEGTVLASVVSILVEVLVTTLSGVPDLPGIDTANTSNLGIKAITLTSLIEVPLTCTE